MKKLFKLCQKYLDWFEIQTTSNLLFPFLILSRKYYKIKSNITLYHSKLQKFLFHTFFYKTNRKNPILLPLQNSTYARHPPKNSLCNERSIL